MHTNETCNCLNDIAQYADDDVIKIQIYSQRICAWMGKFARGFAFVIVFERNLYLAFFIGHKTFFARVVGVFLLSFQWQCWQFLLIIPSCFTNELKKHSTNFAINWKWYCAQNAGNESWLAGLQLMPRKYHRDNKVWKLLVPKLAFTNQSLTRYHWEAHQKFDFNEISFIMDGWIILWVASINQNKSEMMTILARQNHLCQPFELSFAESTEWTFYYKSTCTAKNEEKKRKWTDQTFWLAC